MKEVRRYSDKTITLAARNVRRALKYIAEPALTKRDRVDLLVSHLVKQGLQPSDLARPSGADACVAIASMLRASNNAFDTESYYQPYANLCRKHAKTIAVDSLVGVMDYKTPSMRQVPRMKTTKAGGAFANLDYSVIEARIAARIAALAKPVKRSMPWDRVVDRVMRMPGDV